MCNEKFREVQETELQNLKTSFGHSNVEDLRSIGDDEFMWKPLNVKICLRRQGKLNENLVSIDLTVICDAGYPEVVPQFVLENGKGLSNESVEDLTSTLKNQTNTFKRRRRTLKELVQIVQEFLNKYELSAVPSGYPSSREKCGQHRTSKILHFIDAGKKVQQGCCLGHSPNGCIAFSGIDLETGQLLYITEWFIKNSQLKLQCKVNSCDMSAICSKHGIDEIIADINKQSVYLTQLRQENLIHYEGVHCVKELEGIRVYLAQDFVLGYSIANISNSLEWCERTASMVARGVVLALMYLNSNGVSHNLLCDTAVYIDNYSNIRVKDYTLVPYLQRLIAGEAIYINKNNDLSLLGTLLESLSPTPSSIMRDFIEKCRGAHDSNLITKGLMDEPFLKPCNIMFNDNPDEVEENKIEKYSVDMNSSIVSGSRFQKEFTFKKMLGKGAFGQVFKVQHNVDKVEYAIKQIPLPTSRKLFQSITKEVQLLSGLNHENIVRYNTSWIETAPLNSEYINTDGDTSEWSSSKYTSSQCEFTVFQNKDEDTSDDEELEWDDSTVRFTYIQMEYCGGNTLRKAIDNGLYTKIDHVWRFFREISEGLAYIHKQDIIHRDLKPDNIFIDASKKIKIGDFGLATRCYRPQECTTKLNNCHDNYRLTEGVGTFSYRAPELCGQYDHKVDLYSLGIILFEMSYEPFMTISERTTVIENLRKPSVTIPEALLKNSMYNQNVKVITWLLQHDPCQRPSIKELLSSDLIPPAERDIYEFQEKIRNMIANPQSNQYKNLVAQCIEQECETFLDLTYNPGCVVHSAVDFVKWKIMNLFRKHGGIEIVTPLLTPCSKNRAVDQNAVRLMTHSGNTMFLPHDLRLPFARHVALNGITSIRRYSIDHIYREEKVFNCHPKQLCECAFDIITPTPGSLLVDAELLSIAYEILNEVPTLRQKKISFRINHTTLLRAFLMHFNIPTDKCDEFFDKLQQYSNDKITVVQLKQILRPIVKNQKSVAVLCNLLQIKLQIAGQSTAIINTIFHNLFKKHGSAISLAKAAIRELESVVTLAQGLGVSCAFNLVLGLAGGSVPTKSGRILWQMVAEDKMPRNRKKRCTRILATGERYDSFFSEFLKPLDIHIVENVFSGAGFTFSLDNIMQILSFEVRNNIGWSPISVVVWVSGSHAPLNDVTAMLNSLWAAEISSGFVETTSWVEAKYMAKKLGAAHIIEFNPIGTLTLHSFTSNDILCEGKQLTSAALINTIQRMLKPDEQNLRVINNGLRRQILNLKRDNGWLLVRIKKSKSHERTKKSELVKNNIIPSVHVKTARFGQFDLI